jgi:hypothetical protein
MLYSITKTLVHRTKNKKNTFFITFLQEILQFFHQIQNQLQILRFLIHIDVLPSFPSGTF